MILFRILTRSQTRLVLVEILIKLPSAQHCSHQCKRWHLFWSSNLYFIHLHFHENSWPVWLIFGHFWSFLAIYKNSPPELVTIHCGPGGSALWWMTATCLILGHRDNSGEKDDSAKNKKPPLTLCTFFTFCFVMTRLKGWPVWCWMVMPDYLTDFFSVVVWTLEVYIWRKTFQRIKCLWNLSKIR